jgi:lysophospholipase L1-like esterase
MIPRMVLTAVVALAIAAPSSASAAGLLALGDSYSSGQGAGLYERGTTGHGNTCFRSPLAWPQLLRTRLGLARLDSLACNGAVTAEVLYSDVKRKQKERKTSQVARIKGDPDIITITIGGNDAHFADVLGKCASPLGSCVRRYVKRSGDVIEGWIHSLAKRLPDVYLGIKGKAPRARVVVVGYPRIFPSDPEERTGNCAVWGFISPREAGYLNEKGHSLNAAIERAASRAGVEFIDVADAFDGRELRCHAKSYVNQFRLGHIWQSFHPNPDGYARLAAVVQKRMRNFRTSPLAP